MSRLVGKLFNDAPHVVVGFKSVRRSEFLGPKHFHIIRQPVLNFGEHLSNFYHIALKRRSSSAIRRIVVWDPWGLWNKLLSLSDNCWSPYQLFFRMVLARRVGRIFFRRLRSQIFSRNIICWFRVPEKPNNFGLRTLAQRPSIIAALRLYSTLDFICWNILKLYTLTTNMWLVRTSTTTYRRSQMRQEIQI